MTAFGTGVEIKKDTLFQGHLPALAKETAIPQAWQLKHSKKDVHQTVIGWHLAKSCRNNSKLTHLTNLPLHDSVWW